MNLPVSWRTRTAGVALVLTGLGSVLSVVALPDFDVSQLRDGVLVALGGLAPLGLGGKLDKLIRLLNRD